jgi:hypothetical protein
MRSAMDEVSFERSGTEVHMQKQSGSEQGIPAPVIHNGDIRNRVVQTHQRRTWPGVRIVDLHAEHLTPDQRE